MGIDTEMGLRVRSYAGESDLVEGLGFAVDQRSAAWRKAFS